MSDAPLLLLGVGRVGMAVARAGSSRRIHGTTRRPARAAELEGMGIAPLLLDRDIDGLKACANESNVVVTFPPDGRSDALLAAFVASARSIVYVSSTGVYGDRRGRVDESTPVDASSPRARERVEAERIWRDAGAAIVRAAGIYGSEYGLHTRVRDGSYRIPGDGSRVVSRIHEDDLAAIVLAALDQRFAGQTFVAADACPVPQIDVVRWLSARLGVALPPSIPLEIAPPTLRGDRSIDSSSTLRTLQVDLTYPSYVEGFEACLR